MKKRFILLFCILLGLTGCTGGTSSTDTTEKKIHFSMLELDIFSTKLSNGKLLSNESIVSFEDSQYEDITTLTEDEAKEYRKQVADRLGVDIEDTRIFHVPHYIGYGDAATDFYFVVPTVATMKSDGNILNYKVLNQDLYSTDDYNPLLVNTLEVYIYKSPDDADPYMNDVNRALLRDNLKCLYYNGDNAAYPNISKNVIRDEFKLTTEVIDENGKATGEYQNFKTKIGEYVYWVECIYSFQKTIDSEAMKYSVLYPIRVTVTR